VDAGGDIAISGLRSDGDAWPVGILDPFHPEKHFMTLRLGVCGVATSGIDYHRWQQDGQLRHHIIDPRTGMSAETDVLAATVIAADAVRAEAEAKAVVIAGSRSGMERIESDPTLAGVVVLQNGEIQYSHNMDSFLWKISNKLIAKIRKTNYRVFASRALRGEAISSRYVRLLRRNTTASQ
jgi:thiamine biosynthesis lipoprotein